MTDKEKRKKIDDYVRNCEIHENAKPKMHEIMKNTQFTAKFVKTHLKSFYEKYPKELLITQEEQDILDIYNDCESYQDVSYKTEQKYQGCYMRIMRLIKIGLIEDMQPHSTGAKKKDENPRYFTVKSGKHKGLGGFTMGYGKGVMKCTIYKDKEAKAVEINSSELRFYGE
jgi:hypothetical protein